MGFEIAYIVAGYLLGSFPSGLILTKMAGLGDIRQIGSGNIGTTNVLRTGNKALAALTLFLDAFKGMMAVTTAVLADNPYILMATALAAIIGHMYPIWLGFKGGKGVATTFGVMIALKPPLAFTMIFIWLGMAFYTKLSSLSALTAFALAPVLALLIYKAPSLAVLSLVIAVLVFWKHRENIHRLINGTETKINFKKNDANEKKDTEE